MNKEKDQNKALKNYDDVHLTYGCPQCGSKNYKEEGNNHHQTDDEMEYVEYYKCQYCGHRFVM